jgi:hypothetical protein
MTKIRTAKLVKSIQNEFQKSYNNQGDYLIAQDSLQFNTQDIKLSEV